MSKRGRNIKLMGEKGGTCYSDVGRALSRCTAGGAYATTVESSWVAGCKRGPCGFHNVLTAVHLHNAVVLMTVV